MKVLYIHQHFATPSSPGASRAFEFARRLVEAGHDVTVVAGDRHAARGWIRRDVDNGIQVIWIGVKYDQTMAPRRRIASFLRFAVAASVVSLVGEYDVVYASSTPLTVVIPGVIASRIHRVPLVFEVRDLWPELPIVMGALNSRLSIAAARALEWIGYHASAHVVALSPGIAEGVRKRGYPDEQITVIPNAADLQLFEQVASRRPGQSRLVVYTGAIGRINGPRYLVDLAVELLVTDPRARLKIVGAGAQLDDLVGYADATGVLGKNVEFSPPVAKRDLPEVLDEAALCLSVFLPIAEMEANSANKFFDYLAAGRPVGINYGGWQDDLVRESGCGIVLDSDPAAAARQVALFLDDVDAQRAAGVSARKLAETQFSREELALAQRHILEAVAGAARRRRGKRRSRDARADAIVNGSIHSPT